MNSLSRKERLISASQTLNAVNQEIGSAALMQPRSKPIDKAPAELCLETFSGRFTEISGASAGAALTLAFRLVFEAQEMGEPTAWITSRKSTFYPPDAANSGIDIAAVVVIKCPDNVAAARNAEHLLRSGAFGVVVIDLGAEAELMQHAQSRLAGQARQHHTALICITEKEIIESSLGSLVSLRIHSERLPQKGHQILCRANVLKDKRLGPGWSHVEVCHGPDGLY